MSDFFTTSSGNPFSFKENSNVQNVMLNNSKQTGKPNQQQRNPLPFSQSMPVQYEMYGGNQMQHYEPEPMQEIVEENSFEDIDQFDHDDEMQATEYVNEIYEYNYQKERKNPISINHLSGQTEITSKMRAILIDWLVEVHELFKLISETLYRTVDIVDRYLEACHVNKSSLQLLGVTSMLIASKFEEIYAPEIKDFIYITDGAYDEHQILQMEQDILRALDFNIANPTPLHFLRRFSKAAGSDYMTHTLCKYLIEISTLDVKMLNYYPSQIAASAVYLARTMGRSEQVWTMNLKHYTAYTSEDIKNCVLDLNSVAHKVTRANLKSIYDKFSHTKYQEVALIPLIRNDNLRF